MLTYSMGIKEIVRNTRSIVNNLDRKLENLQMALGRIEARQVQQNASVDLREKEFQVFSQWGEDGIIQYLIQTVPITERSFIEFGIQNYTESNTRFLLKNNNWRGLVIDGSKANIEYVKDDSVHFLYNLTAVCAFIDKDNINTIIQKNGFEGDVGLLSIDIDGNDYWVWKEINVILPRIVICEYNSLFGPHRKVTVPYNPEFMRNKAHYSDLYYGASIAALVELGSKKGYVFVGGNTAGNNLFFVRKDVQSKLQESSIIDQYRKSMFKESKDRKGMLTKLDHSKGLYLIRELPLVDLEMQQILNVSDIFPKDKA